ncbi:hypothetical protein, partial [Schaalia hyovaginalis]|uniref:hypothetical protein n=1 Tax=Schaalia hyovaginalis TaxID=29316 RepID=UPI001F28CCFE
AGETRPAQAIAAADRPPTMDFLRFTFAPFETCLADRPQCRSNIDKALSRYRGKGPEIRPFVHSDETAHEYRKSFQQVSLEFPTKAKRNNFANVMKSPRREIQGVRNAP